MISNYNNKPLKKEEDEKKGVYKWIKNKLYKAYSFMKREFLLIATLSFIGGAIYWKYYL